MTLEETNYFMRCVSKEEVEDYQITAWLMAVFLNGMDKEETCHLVDAMANSGKRLYFNDPSVVDKHSSGGVGDKTSFIVAPLAATCGIKVPMVAGRGLGHTGGTIDKAESIPGFYPHVSMDDFSQHLEKTGLLLTCQSQEIAPADKKLYSLRDVTATICSLPLITSSILSKKIASGVSGLVMDVKYGSGAFMKTVDEGRKLASFMIEVGKSYGISIIAFLSNMNRPLGQCVGHSLEIKECIEVLKGKSPRNLEDLEELSVKLTAGMVLLGKKASTMEEAEEKTRNALKSGKALKKFEQFIQAQGGDKRIISQPELLPSTEERYQVKARSSGSIESFQNDAIGQMVLELGGGRKKASDSIDFAVGLEFFKKPGDVIERGETIFTVHHHHQQNSLVKSLEKKFFQEIMVVSPKEDLKREPLIAEILYPS